ncbi:BadF/BadG/BcrA/BcrD ATPase family protein, partial [Teladorsagia circumcincta]
DNWSIEDLLVLSNLQGRLIRTREVEGNSVQICVVYRREMTSEIFCGIEGGASASKLVFVNTSGETLAEASTSGTNYNLDGIERTASFIATWVRETAAKNHIALPLKGLGLGLSGAEGARDNALFIEYLKVHHGDLADHLYLASDAVATVAAAFEQGGVILIAGTGSSCRVLLNNGRVFGVGGWGHQIGDGGSGFWIAIRAIRIIFDEDDGMEIPHESTALIRELLLKHFKIEDKVDILEYLYNKFRKSHIASFTGELAKRMLFSIAMNLFFKI